MALEGGEYGGVDHRGLALHVEIGHSFFCCDTRLGLAYNVGTGDGDADADEQWTFDNQYPFNHTYYGYMDFFALQNVHNIESDGENVGPRHSTVRYLPGLLDRRAGGGIVVQTPVLISSDRRCR